MAGECSTGEDEIDAIVGETYVGDLDGDVVELLRIWGRSNWDGEKVSSIRRGVLGLSGT